MQELNITASGTQSLLSAEVIVDASNHKVNTFCGSSTSPYGCFMANFFYEAQGPVRHTCLGDIGCYFSSIHAISPITLHCKNQDDACDCISVVWPTDSASAQASRLIFDVDGGVRWRNIYLANTESMLDVSCPGGGGCNSISVDIIYGSKFDEHCELSDSSVILSDVVQLLLKYMYRRLRNVDPGVYGPSGCQWHVQWLLHRSKLGCCALGRRHVVDDELRGSFSVLLKNDCMS